IQGSQSGHSAHLSSRHSCRTVSPCRSLAIVIGHRPRLSSISMASPKKDRWADQFISYLEAERSASPRTVIAYRHALQQFRAFRGGEVTWHSVSVSEFREFLLACMKEDMARSYVRLTFAALRSFYRFSTERAGLSANPLKEVSLPKLEKKLPIVLSIAQVGELLDKPNQVQKKNQAPAWAISRDVAILELIFIKRLSAEQP